MLTNNTSTMWKTHLNFCWIYNRRRIKKYHGLPVTLCVCVTVSILCVAVLNVFSAVTRVYGSRAILSDNITQKNEITYRRLYRSNQDSLHKQRGSSQILLDIDQSPESAYIIHDLSYTGEKNRDVEKETFLYFDDYEKENNELKKPKPNYYYDHHLQRISKGASKRLPQAIIIGVRRCGTKALLTFLRVHPDIRAASQEVHYFDKHYKKGLEWYRKQMPPSLSGQITIEKTPSYYVVKGIAEKVYKMSKHTKLLIVVRDPVRRVLSEYVQLTNKHPANVRPLDEMVFIDNKTGLVDTSWSAIRIGVYATNLERWLKFFPLKQIHFISGENLMHEPAGEIDKVQDFLGIKKIINVKHFYFNKTRGYACLKKHERHGKPRCIGSSKQRNIPHVEPRLISRLKDFYRPFNRRLYEITGRNFGWG